MAKNYYDILGVKTDASAAEIRNRFRELARKTHPDRYDGEDKVEAELKFQSLTEAMNVLTNEPRRKQHDMMLETGSGRAASDPATVAKAYMTHGVKAYKAGDFQAAVDAFDMAIKHHDGDAKTHHYLAMAASRIPSLSRQAVTAAEAAVQKEPYNPTYLIDAGQLCRQVGLLAKAERYLEEALKWDQENADIVAALSEVRATRASRK